MQKNLKLVTKKELLLQTGVRASEFRYLKWSDIREDVITFHTTKTKRANRNFPLSEDLKTILNKIKKLQPKNVKYVLNDEKGRDLGDYYQVSKIVKRYMKLAKLNDKYTCHSLRPSFISHQVIAGVLITTVCQLAGHSQISTTILYTHLSPEILQIKTKYY